jgi:hypothetical protein
MKLTKKLLNENKIYNSWGISELTGKPPFIAFSPALHGRGSRNAKWQVIRIGFNTDPKVAWYDNYNKTFDIWNRQEKEPKLAEAKAWVKEKYSLDMTERDVWGNWHVTGTMYKLKEIIQGNKEK